MSVQLTRSDHFNELISHLKQNKRDLTIIGKGSEKIQVSLLNIVLSSYYLEDLIMLATNSQPFEPVTIYLIDYDINLINILLEYTCTGIGQCETQSDYQDLIELTHLLQIKSTHPSIKIDTIIHKIKLEDDSIDISENIKEDHDSILDEKEDKEDKQLTRLNS